jgi:hypothetical protein
MSPTNFSTLPAELRQKIVSNKDQKPTQTHHLSHITNHLQFTHLFNLLISSNYHLSPAALSIMSVSHKTRSEARSEWTRRLSSEALSSTLALRESVKAFCYTSKQRRKGMMHFPSFVKAAMAHKQKFIELEKRLCNLRLVDELLRAPKTGSGCEEREGCAEWADRVADGEAGWPFTEGSDCEG